MSLEENLVRYFKQNSTNESTPKIILTRKTWKVPEKLILGVTGF